MNFGLFFRDSHCKRYFPLLAILPLTLKFFEIMRPVPGQIANWCNRKLAHDAIRSYGGIIITIIVVITILKGSESGFLAALLQLVTNADALHNNVIYFWLTAELSGFLRNAPDYLILFNSAGGDFSVLQGILVTALLAILARTVFICANEYIRNELNFIVKPVPGCRGTAMSGLWGDMGWLALSLMLLFGLVAYRFLYE